MNKLLVLISLFISSFFLFSFSVKAEEEILNYDFDINNYINENFLMVREKVLEFLPESGYTNYFIIYSFASDRLPYLVFFYNSNKLFTNDTNNSFSFTSAPLYIIKNINNGLVLNTNSAMVSFNISSFYTLLDGNVNFYFNNKTFKVNYNGLTYLVDNNNSLPSLYSIYKDINNVSEENIHQEELNILSNFYNTVIDKLEYISEVFVSNYIYLSILVIFLLVFVFELIFRRFL